MKTVKIIILTLLLCVSSLINAQEWSPPRVVSIVPHGHIDPDFYIDNNHVIHNVWSHRFEDNYRRIYYSKSFDYGHTWSSPKNISQNNSLWAGNPHIIGDSQGQLHVTYDFNLGVPENSHVRYTSCNEDGIWNPSDTISEQPWSRWNRLLIDQNDKIYCFWLHNFAPFEREVPYKIFENGIWSERFITPYPEIKGCTPVVVDPNNNLLFTNYKLVDVGYPCSILVYYTLSADGMWSELTQLSENSLFGFPDITVDAQGKPHIIRGEITKRDEFNIPTHEGTIHQYYNGSAWKEDLLVEIPGTNLPTFQTAIAFDKYNQPHIIQMEYRDNSNFHMHYQLINNQWIGTEINENESYGFIYNKLISHNGYLYLEYLTSVNGNGRIMLRTLEEKPIATMEHKVPMTSLQVSPNPLETQSTIDYSLQQAATVTVKVYNTKGDCVKIWSPRQQSAGSYQLTWNGTDHNGNRLPKGIYVVSLHAGKYLTSKKVVISN